MHGCPARSGKSRGNSSIARPLPLKPPTFRNKGRRPICHSLLARLILVCVQLKIQARVDRWMEKKKQGLEEIESHHERAMEVGT